MASANEFPVNPDASDSSTTQTRSEPDDKRNALRENWGNKLDFLLSVVGFCVGYGNIWRFPYLCYRNGGGVFLIPYIMMLFLVGVPLYYLELAIGQYASLGPIEVWKLSPMFKGLGVTVALSVALVALYYNTLLAYVFFYFFASMTKDLPWASCEHEWNTVNCTVRDPSPAGGFLNSSIPYNGSRNEQLAFKSAKLNSTFLLYPTPEVTNMISSNNNNNNSINISTTSFILANGLAIRNITHPKTPAEEYFERHVLDLSSGPDDLGGVRWQIFLCFLLAWITIYVCVAKGIKVSGKVVYFTATFPYLVLVILLIRGLTLPGSFEGLKYYVMPQWHYLKSPRVWGEAASQIFYSLGPAWGCLIVYASYNKFHNKCNRDAVLASCICSGTSLLAGAVIFSVLGFMSNELNVPISEVMTSGPGLVFVAYPEAISRMPAAPFWAVIFFFMLLTVGLDSSFAHMELFITVICDAAPKLAKRKWLVALTICVCYVIAGIPFTTRGGMYLVNLVDWYSATFTFTFIGIVENLVIIYIYGYSNLEQNIKLMIGTKPSLFYKICWYFITPTLTSFILIFTIATHTPVTYGDVQYPRWAVTIGIFLGTAPMLCIPVYMIYHVGKFFGSWTKFAEALKCPWNMQVMQKLFSPSPDWGPMMAEHRLPAGLGTTEEQQAWLGTEMKTIPKITIIEEGVNLPLQSV